LVNDSLGTRVLASIERAIVGAVPPEIRAVAVEWSAAQVLVRVFAEQAAPDSVREEFDEDVITQVVADFPYPDRGDPRIDLVFVRGGAPIVVPAGAVVVFVRADVTVA
jgi:hypothetical protein